MLVGRGYGVAKDATLLSCRFLSCAGDGSYADFTTCVAWSYDVMSAQDAPAMAVASMSVSGGVDTTLNAYITNMVDEYRIIVVVAAGNFADDASHYTPSSAAGVIAVAASQQDDTMASFSNWGVDVRMGAPGVDVPSYTINNDATSWSGTSASSPLTAGAALLLLEQTTAALGNGDSLPSAASMGNLLIATSRATMLSAPSPAPPLLYVAPAASTPPPGSQPVEAIVPPPGFVSTSAGAPLRFPAFMPQHQPAPASSSTTGPVPLQGDPAPGSSTTTTGPSHVASHTERRPPLGAAWWMAETLWPLGLVAWSLLGA